MELPGKCHGNVRCGHATVKDGQRGKCACDDRIHCMLTRGVAHKVCNEGESRPFTLWKENNVRSQHVSS